MDSIMQICRDAGLNVRMGDAGALLVTPAARITPEIRGIIRDHKADLLLALSDTTQDPFDDRHRCTDCRHLWPGNFCLTHRRAGLSTRELAADFAHLMQRCPAWSQGGAA